MLNKTLIDNSIYPSTQGKVRIVCPARFVQFVLISVRPYRQTGSFFEIIGKASVPTDVRIWHIIRNITIWSRCVKKNHGRIL